MSAVTGGAVRPVPGVDDDVPGLLCAGVPELRSGAWTLRSWDTERVHRHHGRRFVFGQMAWTEAASGRAETAAVAIKVYASDHGDRAFQALRSLWAAGFRPPSSSRVPRPFGFSPDRRALIQEMVPGRSWAATLVDDSSPDASAGRAAHWLVRLQAAPVELDGSSTPHPFSRIAPQLAERFPDRGARLTALAARVSSGLAEAGPRVPSHGDLHPENLHLAPETVWGLDLDNAGQREPAYDVGYAIGQLLVMSVLRTGNPAVGARAGLAFWRAYEERGGAAPWHRVAVQVARTFLQSLHHELCTLDNGRDDLLDPWTAHVDLWLSSPGPVTLEDLVRDR